MENKPDVVFYGVKNGHFESAAGDNSMLCAVRRKFLESGTAESGRDGSVESGQEMRIHYRISRHAFEWEKKSGGRTVQQAYPVKGGYELITWNRNGEPVSKARFDRDHKWQQTAYYAEGTKESGAAMYPEELLRPDSSGGLKLLRRDGDSGRYRVTLLRPCALRPGTPEQSMINDKAGVPAVCAETSLGSFCYCMEEEARLRERLMAGMDGTLPEVLDLKPEQEQEDPLPDFTYIENDREPELPVSAPAVETAPLPFTLEEDYPSDREILCIEPEDRPSRYAVAAKNREGMLVHTPDVDQRPQVECISCPEDMERIAREAEEPRRQGAAGEDDVPARQKAPESLMEILEREAQALACAKEAELAAESRMAAAEFSQEAVLPEGDGTDMETDFTRDGAARPAKWIQINETERYAYYGGLCGDLRDGQGRTEMPNGRTAYEGGYKRDKRDGFGIYYYKSGKVNYVGNWKENKRHGMGVSYSARDGSVFIGHWENNLPEGKGSAFDAEGRLLYTGDWSSGVRCGYGTEYRNGRAYYAGEWAGDRWNGRGRLRLENGTMITGLFENGRVQGLNDGEEAPRG